MPGAKKQPKQAKERPLSAREEAFCAEYLIDLNASQAAIRAGYKASASTVTSTALMKRPAVAARIAELKQARAQRVEMQADDVVKRLVQIVTADARLLTSHRIGACRYCHGIDHLFQWRTQREFDEACAEASRKDKAPPDCSGGFGYRRTAAPNPDCPECDGLGAPYTHFADTNSLPPEVAVLFEGVKETRNGIEFKMADKGKALDRLADHLGIRSNAPEETANAFTDMLAQLLRSGSKAPIRPDPSPKKGGEG